MATISPALNRPSNSVSWTGLQQHAPQLSSWNVAASQRPSLPSGCLHKKQMYWLISGVWLGPSFTVLTVDQVVHCMLAFLLFSARFHCTSACMHDGIELFSQPWLLKYHDPHAALQLEMLKAAGQPAKFIKLDYMLCKWSISTPLFCSLRLQRTLQCLCCVFLANNTELPVLALQEVDGPWPSKFKSWNFFDLF